MSEARAAAAADVGGALLRPVRSGNAYEETVARLLQSVRLGVVPPGDALPSERELAVRLAVSRDTVREAIKALADAGYLERRRGRYGGAFVLEHPRGVDAAGTAAPPSAVELADVLGLRRVLEEGAVRLAAGRALSAAERDELWTRMLLAAAAPAADYRRLDSRLHLALGELAGVPSLLPLLADARDRTNRLLDAIPLLPPNLAHSNEQHEAIVHAVLRGDPEASVRAMRAHLDGTEALLTAFLG